jgi:hypothetical protein
MLTLALYRDNVWAAAEVRVDPATVAGVAESFRVRAATLVPVALVTLTTGQQFSVEDPARDVAERIQEAQRRGGV